MNRLYAFNPGHEEALAQAHAPSYTPKGEVRQMMQDLGELMLLLCEEGDYVALPRSDGSLHLIDYRGEAVRQPNSLPTLTLCPWALERHFAQYIRKSAERLGLRLDIPPITTPYLHLAHRASSTMLIDYLERMGWSISHLRPIWLHRATANPLDLDTLLRDYQERGINRLVLKRPYTSSGRGVLPLAIPLTTAEHARVWAFLRRSGSISLEPWLDIVQDWAVEYYYDRGVAHYVGLSKFQNKAGSTAYEGNRLAPETQLRGELIAQIGQTCWQRLLEGHQTFLEQQLGQDYTGYIGIDMCLYQRGEAVHLHPAVEINARCTMGLLAHLAYLRHVAPLASHYGPVRDYTFRLDHFTHTGQALELYLSHTNSPSPAPHIPLTHPTAESHFYAYLAPTP